MSPKIVRFDRDREALTGFPSHTTVRTDLVYGGSLNLSLIYLVGTQAHKFNGFGQILVAKGSMERLSFA